MRTVAWVLLILSIFGLIPDIAQHKAGYAALDACFVCYWLVLLFGKKLELL